MRIKNRKNLAVISVTCIFLAFCISLMPANALSNTSWQSIPSNAGATTYRIPVGSFIQDYMTAYWDDSRWQNELAVMKEAGMNYLIFSPSVVKDDLNGYVRTIYPSKIAELQDGYGGIDCIDACLRNCEQAGMKVFIALNQDPGQFWSMGWKISNTQPDMLTQYWQKNTELSNKVANELYSLYKSKYQHAFYGWYWVHEFWNYTICTNAYENKDPNSEKYQDKVAADPTVYTDIFAKEALSPVLDHLTTIDSAMPMMFSTFCNPTLCLPESQTRLWTDIIKNTSFRPGDIWAPMDNMGGGLMTLDILDTWTAATKKAAEANSNLHFWINNEEQVVYADWNTGKQTQPMDDEVATLDRCVKQIEITSKYAEQNVFFTWNHYYSPYNTMPGYNQTYMQYIQTGSIEKNAPSAIDLNDLYVSKSHNTYSITWKAPADDTGIANYNIYKDNELIAHLHPNRFETSGKKPVLATKYTGLAAGEYEIEAIDFAGNASAKLKFTVDAAAVTRIHTVPTTTTATVSNPTLTTSENPSQTTSLTTSSTKAANPDTGINSLPITAVLFTLLSAVLLCTVKTKKQN